MRIKTLLMSYFCLVQAFVPIDSEIDMVSKVLLGFCENEEAR
jgi:hypothetical protein